MLGQTLDDAAGEAFDKGARLLGLGYPGGPEVDRLARDGDPEAFAFPRSAPGELDFSFSGLKTSLLYRSATSARRGRARRADLAASYQRAIVEALVARARAGARARGARAAGDRRRRGGELASCASAVGGAGRAASGCPPIELCTDNAAMIAGAARFAPARRTRDYLALDASRDARP